MATVSLTAASKEDAATVFGVLRMAFPTDRSLDDMAQEQPGDHSVVWTAEFEPARERIPTDPVPLDSSVSATLQGAYAAVDQLFEALSTAFAVDHWGAASGDQGKEVDVRLSSKR
ncbi:hypothetical protein [Streptomyces sp. N50]|uniref:hypothetical protein n=1 Tax=Streptomyces sp. N50 TaxID=3081765 RepID=UPI0029622567|nr:hypothetical protein [Streptomyces sp. N50]WOX07380.1 hypothetical protein R2B38_00235 [Streptomyces sp. N50]